MWFISLKKAVWRFLAVVEVLTSAERFSWPFPQSCKIQGKIKEHSICSNPEACLETPKADSPSRAGKEKEESLV